MLSTSGLEGAYRSSTASTRGSSHGESFLKTQHASSVDQIQSPADMLPENASARISHSDDIDVKERLNEFNKPVFLDDISLSTDETVRKDEGLLDSCGIIPSNCLPCLALNVPSIEKRRSLSSSPPSARKKVASMLSFKWREGHANASLRK